MFDAPFEDWYVWVGVATVSVAVLALVVGLPTAPPDAVAVADTVDRVAASPSGAIGSTRIRADAIRIDRRRVALRGPGGTAHATVAYGPMTPVGEEGTLAGVLAGDPPSDVFDSPTDFGTATERALDEPASWRPAPETVRVRSVSWEGVDVLLVG